MNYRRLSKPQRALLGWLRLAGSGVMAVRREIVELQESLCSGENERAR